MAREPKPVRLTFSPAAYNPQGLSRIPEREIRQEYTRLRDIAQKRLRRLGESEFSSAASYQWNRDRFKPLREVQSPAELAHLLIDVTKFLQARSSSVQGMKNIQSETVNTLQAKGYDCINKTNIRQFGEFMEWYRERYNQKKGGNSEAVAQLFNYAADPDKQIPPDQLRKHFLSWMEKYYGEDARKDLQNARRRKLYKERKADNDER